MGYQPVQAAIFLLTALAVQPSLGDAEQYLISNAETGERKMWEEDMSEASPRRERRNAGYKYGLTNEEIRAIVDTHNTLRNVSNPTAANMRKMRWSPLIAENAQNYTCGCNSYHSSSAARQLPGLGKVGENIWVGTHNRGVAGQVWSWYNEEPHYDYETSTCSRSPCGHYTQGAWHNSYQVGCGFTECEEAEGFFPGKHCFLLVCQYFHVGNYAGAKPYENGTACSNCPADFQGGCDANSLCTPDVACGGETCQNGGVMIDDGHCVCNCTSGYTGAYCESIVKEICPRIPDVTAAPESMTNAPGDDEPSNSTTTGNNAGGNHVVFSLYALKFAFILAVRVFF